MLAAQIARVTMQVAVKTAADQQPGVDQVSTDIGHLSYKMKQCLPVFWLCLVYLEYAIIIWYLKTVRADLPETSLPHIPHAIWGALDGIPLALAENSGLPPFDTLTAVNPQQVMLFFFFGNP